MIDLTRRSLLRGLFAAPAIVAVGNIMPVKLWVPPPPPQVVAPADLAIYRGVVTRMRKTVGMLDNFVRQEFTIDLDNGERAEATFLDGTVPFSLIEAEASLRPVVMTINLARPGQGLADPRVTLDGNFPDECRIWNPCVNLA